MNKVKALIFDVNGTMVDSERHGHLPASNRAMKQIGLNIQWDWEHFKQLIQNVPGSVNRLKRELASRDFSTEEILDYVEGFETLKNKIYMEEYLPKLKIKAGVNDMIQQAIDQNVRLAIVSTSYENQIHALLTAQFPKFEKYFEFMLGKETGEKIDNNGYLHKKCLNLLQLNAHEVIMIEDSAEGTQAAVDAHIATAVFYNDYTYGEAFHFARLVAPDMSYFSLNDLEKICLTSNENDL